METDYTQYHQFLTQRSRLALFYRRFYLYPILSRSLYGRVLDIGPGLGDFLRYYKKAVGVDVNPDNVDYCRRVGLEVYMMEDNQFPFKNESFDGAMFDNVLEHIDNPEPTLKEIHRVLIPNGRLVVGVPGEKGYYSAPDHRRFYSEEALVAVLGKSGFKKKKIHHMPVRSAWLDKNMRQYCIYAIFETVK